MVENSENYSDDQNLIKVVEAAIERFREADRIIDNLLSIINITQDPELKSKIRATITQLIKDRDQKLNQTLPSLDSSENPDMINHQMLFRQSPEAMSAIGFAMSHGLYEVLTVENFPMLGSLPENARRHIELIAMEKRLQLLEERNRPLLDRSGGVHPKTRQAKSSSDYTKVVKSQHNEIQKLRALYLEKLAKDQS